MIILTPWAHHNVFLLLAAITSTGAFFMTQNIPGSTLTRSIPTSIDSMPPLFSSPTKYINDSMKAMEVIVEADEKERVGKNTNGDDDAFLEDNNDENLLTMAAKNDASIGSSVLSSDEEESSITTSIISGNMEIPTSELDILEDLIEVRDWDALLHFAGDVLENQKDEDDEVSSQGSRQSETFFPEEPTTSQPTAYHDDKDDDDTGDNDSYEMFPFRSRRREYQCCQWPLLHRMMEGVSSKNILIFQPSDDKSSHTKRIAVE